MEKRSPSGVDTKERNEQLEQQSSKEIYFPSALLDGYFCALSAVLLQRLHFNCPAFYL